MRRFLTALLGLLIGYPVFAVLGYFAISLFSGNHFDGSVEASMTAAFVFGPAGAIIGMIAGIVVGKKKGIARLTTYWPRFSSCGWFIPDHLSAERKRGCPLATMRRASTEHRARWLRKVQQIGQ